MCMQGTLPGQWGLNGSFIALVNLTLSFNPGISGGLPDVWGISRTSFRKLKALELNNCNLTGTLPAAWATQLPALRGVNVSSNFLTGMPSAHPLPQDRQTTSLVYASLFTGPST